MPVPPDELTEIASRLPGLRLLLLHGSRARGQAHSRSDWDLAYVADSSLDPEELRAALGGHLDTDAVDLADLETAGALLRYRVARDGVLLFETKPGTFEAFRMDAIHTWCDMEPVLTPLYEQALRDLERVR
jgi:predicted nucleotidyltransferase